MYNLWYSLCIVIETDPVWVAISVVKIIELNDWVFNTYITGCHRSQPEIDLENPRNNNIEKLLVLYWLFDEWK